MSVHFFRAKNIELQEMKWKERVSLVVCLFWQGFVKDSSNVRDSAALAH